MEAKYNQVYFNQQINVKMQNYNSSNELREPLKKTQEFRICSEKGGSPPIRNSYFDLVSEDSMLTGSPNQENEQVFRWLRRYFSQY